MTSLPSRSGRRPRPAHVTGVDRLVETAQVGIEPVVGCQPVRLARSGRAGDQLVGAQAKSVTDVLDGRGTT
jgi:hypothetical protein